MNEVLTTNRLILRSFINSDLDTLYHDVFSDVEVMKNAFTGRTLSKLEVKDFVDNNFDHVGTGTKLGVLTLKGSAIPIGFAGLLTCEVLGKEDYEIGFVLSQKYWGQGFASEIGFAQIEYGFHKLARNRLFAFAAPQNHASVKVLQKLGLKYHSTIENVTRGTRDIYSISKKCEAIF